MYRSCCEHVQVFRSQQFSLEQVCFCLLPALRGSNTCSRFWLASGYAVQCGFRAVAAIPGPLCVSYGLKQLQLQCTHLNLNLTLN